MKKLWLLAGLALVGCASTNEPYPAFINGSYYWSHKEACPNFRNVSPKRIVCYDANGQAIGYLDAMTDQQLQMYQTAMLQQKIRNSQSSSINIQPPVYTPPPTMSMPPVMPVQVGGNQIRCIGTGIYANCRY